MENVELERESDTHGRPKSMEYSKGRFARALFIGTIFAGSITAGCSTRTTAESEDDITLRDPGEREPYGEELSKQLLGESEFVFPEYGPTLDSEGFPEEVTLEEQGESLETEEGDIFDYSILDIAQWRDYKLDNVEKKEEGYVLKMNSPTPLYAIPLMADGFFGWEGKGEENASIDELILTNSTSFEIGEVRTLISPEGEKIEIGLIANSFTHRQGYVYAILLGARDSEGNSIRFAVEEEGESSVVSYISPAETIYPNKIANILVALRSLSEYQDREGPFSTGEEYSALEIFGLRESGGFGNYFVGEGDIKANGICAVSTALSALSHVNDNIIVERWGHSVSEMYRQGPFGPDSRTVDSAVNVEYEESFDFRWIQGEPGYIKVDLEIIPGEYSKEGESALDFAMTLSISFVDDPVEGQAEQLSEQLEEYLKIKDLSLSSYAERYGQPGRMDRGVDDIGEVLSRIYNREDLGVFEGLAERNPIISDILRLGDEVNRYSEDSDLTLSQHIFKSDWYSNYLENFERDEEAMSRVEYAVRSVDHIRIPGEPLQCVMFVAMVSHLYPELGAQYVGGATLEDENGEIRGAATARELVPDRLVGVEGQGAGIPSGGLLTASREFTVDDYNPGDLFVTLDKFGHIGIILAKYTSEEGTKLLVADSNRFVDGRVRVFVVEEGQESTVFGNHKYTISSFTNVPDESFFLRQGSDPVLEGLVDCIR